jgi:hypothetical protein
VIGFFLAALVAGALFFISGMGEASYLVSDGVGYGVHYIDKPRHDSHVQGLIFVLSFLAAGILLLFLVILPDHASPASQPQPAPQPQPRRRPPVTPQPAMTPEPPPVAAPEPPPAAAPQPPPQPQAQAAGAQPTVEIEPEAALAQAAAPEPPAPSVDEEVMTSDTLEAEISPVDLPDSRYEDTGEEDVVYGTGRATDDSIWDFIHNYPDSAVKFLYRKTLENKALSPNEEDIYRRWEMRGISRAKVREYVLEIMGWKTLPDDYPHNIWRELRDQIFELKSKIS